MTPDEAEAAIRNAVEARRRVDALRIERACEAALQGGECGVLVIRDAAGRVLSAAPDSTVPYGRVHERPEQ